MSSSQKDILLNQLAAQYNLNPSKHMMLNPFSSFMMPPNQDFLKLLYANNSFSSLQANYNMMNNGQEPEGLPKVPTPLIPPTMNPLGFGLKKPPFSFDMLSKFDGLGGGINQNVSPASGMSNILKERMGIMLPPLMGNMGRFDDAEQASFIERNRGFNMGFPGGFFNRPKIPAEKKVITIYDEDEDVMECKPEEFKKNVEKSKEKKDASNNFSIQKQVNLIPSNRNHQLYQRKYEHKSTKRSIKSFISIDDSGPQDETKLKFYANSQLLKRSIFKKKTKKGFLSHRKKHRNQKRREKIVLNCKKCNSRIVILTKKTQIPEHKIKDRLCKNCLSETLEKENLEKKNNNLVHLQHKYKAVPKKPKEEDSESKSDTISRYKELQFANSNRILLGENYQAALPEFLLNKPQKMQEWRAKTMEILNHNKIWNPSEENSKLYDEVHQLICATFNARYSHYDFVSMIDQYEGDLKLIKEKLERKDAGLLNLINESISTSGKKRVTRSSKNKFRRHDIS